MSTPVRVVGFVLVLATAFGLALGVGNAVGPIGIGGETPATHGGPVAAAPAEQPGVGGLSVSGNGYTLRLARSTAPAGTDVALAFTVEGPDGDAVTAYDVQHEKALHLIAVRRDRAGFQHVHPTLGTDGLWLTRLDLTPGSWRIFADFKPRGGAALTLGADLSVAGRLEQPAPPPVSRTAEVDGYVVTLAGDLVPGKSSELTLTVSKGGQPVTDLDPYLGALGHLVALRAGDLAYLHVHPHDAEGAGPEVRFTAEVPSSGEYSLYLDFQHDGIVRTAAFTAQTRAEVTSRPRSSDGSTGGEDRHGH